MEQGKYKKVYIYLTEYELIKLSKYTSKTGITNSDFIKSRIEYVIKSIDSSKTVKELIDQACEVSGVKKIHLMGGSRNRDVVSVRRFLCYALRKTYSFSQEKTGATLGGLDHCTVKYHCDIMEWNIKNEKIKMLPLENELYVHFKLIGLL